jgi:hypothetical protein
MKKFMAGLWILVFACLCLEGQTARPEWVETLPHPNENGVFFRGYAPPSRDVRISLRRAERNAILALSELIMDGTLDPVCPVPEDAKSRSVFSMDRNGRKGEIIVSDITVIARWQDPDGGLYVLCSCTGFEVKEEDSTPANKPLEEKNPLELYLHSLELENQISQDQEELTTSP